MQRTGSVINEKHGQTSEPAIPAFERPVLFDSVVSTAFFTARNEITMACTKCLY
jgi:hypothetical protein